MIFSRFDEPPTIPAYLTSHLSEKCNCTVARLAFFSSRKSALFSIIKAFSSSREVEIMCRKNNRSLRNILFASRENPLGGHHKSNRVAASEQLIPIIQDLPKQLLTKILLFSTSSNLPFMPKSCRRAAIEPTIFTAYSTLTLFG